MNVASSPTVKSPEAIAPALTSSTRPRPTSAAPWLNAQMLSSSTRSRTAVVRRWSTRTRKRARVASAAPFTFTVVAADMMSPRRPLTSEAAARSALRYRLILASRNRVASATEASGSNSTAAAVASRRPSTNAAPAVKTTPADRSTIPSTNMAMSSVSSRKCVSASPAEPTGCPASGPPLATCAASRLARRNDCMCTHACVHCRAPSWMIAMRTASQTSTAAAMATTTRVSPRESPSKPRPSNHPISTGNVKNSTKADQPNQNERRWC